MPHAPFGCLRSRSTAAGVADRASQRAFEKA